MKVYALANGNFLVEVPLLTNVVFNLEMDKKTLIENFDLVDVPQENVFEVEPRNMADFAKMRNK